MLRVIRPDLLDDQLLRRKVGFSHQFDIAFVGNFRRAEPLHQQAAGLTRHINRKVEQYLLLVLVASFLWGSLRAAMRRISWTWLSQ